MNAFRIAAIGLIIAGALALAYGGFSYTRETQRLQLGPIQFSVKEEQTVNIPVWADVGAILLGGLMLAFGARKR